MRRHLAPAVRAEAERLVAALRPDGAAELRRAFAGPLVAGVVCGLLGLDRHHVEEMLGWYDAIVAAVNDLSVGRPPSVEAEAAMRALGNIVTPALRSGGEGSLPVVAATHAAALTEREIVSNVAVLLFGGIETTEGMIANAVLHLLSEPHALEMVSADRGRLPDVVEESLRLEPAAAAVDRYATTDVALGGTLIRAGDLVRISISAANRDPATFEDPHAFSCDRPNARRHLAFAGGPHVCVAMHLARVQAHLALDVLMDGLPGLRLDPERSATVSGLIFSQARLASRGVGHAGVQAA